MHHCDTLNPQSAIVQALNPYAPTNVLCFILQIVLYLEAFECNTSCVTFRFANLGEKDKDCF